ncbi:MAG: uracil-DNA glycosylase [Verrucomicrobia bacterium]|nr:uracil-DNA glycosylase [Verrucomicrobiota bacterium]MDA1067917.1 uracil-DNA glycosylase [Verrucomicrobiota bacterium]
MRTQIELVIDELKRLKQEGVEGIYIGDSTLSDLREKVSAVHSAASPESIDSAVEDPAQPYVSKKSNQKGESLQDLVKGRPIQKAVEKAKTQVALNQHGKPIPAIPVAAPEINLPEGDKQMRWDALREIVLNDPICKEHLNPGSQVVFGVGNIDAEIFFCGEAPGGDEEKQGEPFVGRAGELLSKIITAMGLSRETVYIGNIMNWRPEMPTPVGNRPPTPEEMAYCLPYLKAQIEVVQPKVIVALGMTAVNGLLGPDPKRRMGEIRGQFFDFDNTSMLVTYHPSYLLRYATMKTKRLVWEDMLLVMERIGMSVSEKQKGFFQ